MERHTYVQPLPYNARRRFFGLLVLVFLFVLPFLYLYATGYRFDLREPTNLVSTGGIYVAVDRTGAEIYVDDELVRETRAFRRAFYAQALEAGTHRVHVQREGYHTWVKELPVVKHRVTEAEAFNLPLVPEVRLIAPFQTATGTMVVRGEIPVYPRIMNAVVATTSRATTTLTANLEHQALMLRFGTTSATETSPKETPVQQIKDLLVGATTTGEVATTTVTLSGVRLFERDGDVFASWTGRFEEMPYYYCAPDFPRYTGTTTLPVPEEAVEDEDESEELPVGFMHPVQTIPKDTVCDPTIKIDRKWQEVRDFDFFPGSTDFVIMVLTDGVYVVEIDDRSWQNVQPLFLGKNLRMHIENGNIFVYDGELMYQVLLTTE